MQKMQKSTKWTVVAVTVVCSLIAGIFMLNDPEPTGKLMKAPAVARAKPVKKTPDKAVPIIKPDTKPETPPPVVPREMGPSRQAMAAAEKIKPHLEEAETAAVKAAERARDRIKDFFTERKKRARDFAEEALSWSSKWALLKSGLGDGDEHHKFLFEKFEEKVFSQKELTNLLKSVVGEYLESLRGIENDLLVKVRADIEDLAPPDLRDADWLKTNRAFRAEFTNNLKSVTDTVTNDLGVFIGREATTWVASDIAGTLAASLCLAVAERMGVSAAITGSGVVSGVTTLGLGIVAGFVIDALLDQIFQAFGYDPVDDVVEETRLALDEFAGIFLSGDKYEPDRPSPFGRVLTDRDYKIMGMEMKRDGQMRRRKSSKKTCKGFFKELTDLYQVRAAMQEAALRKLILKGGE